jgi:YHS domain-containing protein
MKTFISLLSIAIFTIVITNTTPVLAQTAVLNVNSKGLAIDGYDPVAYFAGKPQKGNRDNVFTYKGVTYYFANKSNEAIFTKTPDKYVPAYGGWCAYAMGAKGEKVEVDPETFKIVDGQLLLFYNAYFNNTLTDWNKDENNLKQKAAINWKKFVK